MSCEEGDLFGAPLCFDVIFSITAEASMQPAHTCVCVCVCVYRERGRGETASECVFVCVCV
jgi:hypothetical protein